MSESDYTKRVVVRPAGSQPRTRVVSFAYYVSVFRGGENRAYNVSNSEERIIAMPKLQGYQHFDGRHYETGTVQNYLAYRGVKAPHTGKPYSEAMLMGISGGVLMGYFSFAYKGYDPHVAILSRNTFNPLDTLLTRLRTAVKRPVRLIGVGLSNFVEDVVQLTLEPSQSAKDESLSATFDTIRKKYGSKSLQTGRTAFDKTLQDHGHPIDDETRGFARRGLEH